MILALKNYTIDNYKTSTKRETTSVSAIAADNVTSLSAATPTLSPTYRP